MITVEQGEVADLSSVTSFLQTPWWAEFKARHGWSSLVVRICHETTYRGISILLRRLPLGLCLAYVPLADLDGFDLEELSRQLKSLLPRNTLALRWDLASGTRIPITHDDTTTPEIFPTRPAGSLKKPPADVQPPDTVVVGLGGSLDDILGRMHKKTRYNVRLAEKKGVVVERHGTEAVPEWYALYRETAERDHISIHSQAYYQDLFSLAPDLTLWLARGEGQLLAGNIVLRHGTTSTYLYGASSNEHRNLMAPYALQWAAIQEAHRDGYREYDMFGIPPTDNPTHPMHGLYRFKNGFGGTRIHRQGAWDAVFRPLSWKLWTAVDATRVWYFKVWKKRS